MVDTIGPRIRLGKFEEGCGELYYDIGEEFDIVTDVSVLGNKSVVSCISFSSLIFF